MATMYVWGVLRSFPICFLCLIPLLSSLSHSFNSWPTRLRCRKFRHNFFEINCSRENMSISRMAHTHCNRTLKSDKKHVQVCSFFLGVLYHSSHVNLLMPEYVCPILLFARSLTRSLLFAILWNATNAHKSTSIHYATNSLLTNFCCTSTSDFPSKVCHAYVIRKIDLNRQETM